MIQLLQNFAVRVVAAIKYAELGAVDQNGVGANITAERERRQAWNIAATTFNENNGNPLDETERRPLLDDINITIDGNGVYTYTGIPEPQMIVGIDPGYHFFIDFNRYYAYGSSPIGDPEADNYYPGNQDP